MDIVLLLARLLLAGVFIVAGLTKLADRKGSRQAMRDFGVPTPLAAPLGTLLPIAELAVGAALIPTASARWGALGALALLLAFVAGIGVNLARGKHPDCHCFGQLHSEPAGWSTLIRNGLLAAVAAFVAVTGWDDAGASAVAWLGDLSTVERVALVLGLVGLGLLVSQSWAIFNLMGQNGRLLLRLDALDKRFEDLTDGVASGYAGGDPTPIRNSAPAPVEPGLRVGAPAPNFGLAGLHGETLTLGALRAAGKPVLLVFSDPGCGPCNSLLPDVSRWQREHADSLTVSLISRGTPEANRGKSTEHQLTNILLQQDREVAEAYEANGTPAAVVVRPGGTIGSPLALGADAIRALATRIVSTPASAPSPATALPAPVAPSGAPTEGANGNAAPTVPTTIPGTGDPAPDLTIPDLDGKPVSLGDLQGDPTLVLFWNPGCGFCARMLDDLKAWETNRPTGAPKLLVISTGDVEANRAMGLQSMVVLDQGFAAGNAFGASGTPSAVLLNADGLVASHVVAGAQAVLALANDQDPTALAPATNGTVVPPVRKIGDLAPPVRLPDLDGKMVSLAAQRGTQTLVVFWNPGCGFCSRMLDDLKAWEANRPKRAPRLLVISTGDVETNRAMGFRSPVLLDHGFRVGNAFGASGTPSAALIDAKGKIASEVAVGAQAVLDLATGKREQEEKALSN